MIVRALTLTLLFLSLAGTTAPAVTAAQERDPDAVARAKDLGMDVVEVGRCPVYYLGGGVAGCRAHTFAARMTGLVGKPPNTEADKNRRELM